MSSSHFSVPALWVLGEALVDCVSEANGVLRPCLGGSPFNVACAAALQGMEVSLANPLSSDAFGDAFAQRLQVLGVRSVLPRSLLPTSLAVVHLNAGQPSYSFYRDGIADRDFEVAALLESLQGQKPGVLHTGSLMALPSEIEKTLSIVDAAKQWGWCISVDVNLRPRLCPDAKAYARSVLALCKRADWIKCSDEDAEALGMGHWTLGRAPELAQRFLAESGCKRLALTFGGAGASLHIGSEAIQAPAPRVSVRDTVGAGDTFWATCIADWMQHGKDEATAAARRHQTLQRALVAAAINCTRDGCQPPRTQEIDAAMATLTLGASLAQ